jgi:hypothetical protein
MKACALLLAVFGMAAPVAAQDYPQSWHWIVVTPNDQENWKSERGESGKIDVHGDSFSASLGDGDILLKGSVRNGHVIVVETLMGTDAAPMTFQGDWQRERTRLTDPSNGWGSDRISLYAPGGFYIGLFRHVRSGAPPEKPR